VTVYTKINGAWVSDIPSRKYNDAQGGEESTFTFGGKTWKAHVFRSSGQLLVRQSVDPFVVSLAGAGGGGFKADYDKDGESGSAWLGGGGGGVLIDSSFSLAASSTPYSVTVGSAGMSSDSSVDELTDGGDTSAFGKTATGGKRASGSAAGSSGLPTSASQSSPFAGAAWNQSDSSCSGGGAGGEGQLVWRVNPSDGLPVPGVIAKAEGHLQVWGRGGGTEINTGVSQYFNGEGASWLGRGWVDASNGLLVVAYEVAAIGVASAEG